MEIFNKTKLISPHPLEMKKMCMFVVQKTIEPLNLSVEKLRHHIPDEPGKDWQLTQHESVSGVLQRPGISLNFQMQNITNHFDTGNNSTGLETSCQRLGSIIQPLFETGTLTRIPDTLHRLFMAFICSENYLLATEGFRDNILFDYNQLRELLINLINYERSLNNE